MRRLTRRKGRREMMDRARMGGWLLRSGGEKGESRVWWWSVVVKVVAVGGVVSSSSTAARTEQKDWKGAGGSGAKGA
ncbi:hypothetical protein BDW75DRAFT_219424 [Aspergillus navahoensis]